MNTQANYKNKPHEKLNHVENDNELEISVYTQTCHNISRKKKKDNLAPFKKNDSWYR